MGFRQISFYWPEQVPANKFLLAGIVPANKFLFAGTVPANKFLFAGTVPANNLFLKFCKDPGFCYICKKNPTVTNRINSRKWKLRR